MEAFHITWVTHNSRESERMKKYNVKKGKALVLSSSDEIEVTKYILDVVRKDNIKLLAYNICRDHVHLILICKAEDRDNIVRKLKSVSSRMYNLAHEKTVLQVKNLNEHETINKVRGKVQNRLWAQKYNWTCILNEKQLAKVWGYVTYNRIKHNLKDNINLNKIIEKMLTPYDKVVD